MYINRLYEGHAPGIVIGLTMLVLLLAGSASAYEFATHIEDTSGNINQTMINVSKRIHSGIFFTNPTPANGAILAQNYAYINTTVSNASTAFIDWNRSLVGWWRFNNESGENTTFFKDWSSWKNDATCSGTNCPASTSGKFGKALAFDGVNDYVDAGNASSLNITGNITIEAWVKPERLETAHIVKKATRDSTDGYELSLSESTGKAYFRVNQKTSHNTYKLFSTSKYPLDGNTWVHLVGVYNRDKVQIYFNGNLENSMAGPTNILSNTDNLRIGGPDLSRYFKGTIDEVRIWNRALRPEEIKASYDAGIYRLYSNFTKLSIGKYNYRAYSQNLKGEVEKTKKRTLTLIAGRIITVPDDYAKIQWAINNATAGDIIEVHRGIYFENVKVNKKLTLRGIGNPVVDAGGNGNAIMLSADGIRLEGFTATGSGYPGAGINVTSSNNTLRGNNASNNIYGISLSSSSNNMLSRNNASNNNYGISLSSSSKNNRLSGNNASNNNYGIYLSSSSNNKIYNNIFNNIENFYFSDSSINAWNTTRQSDTSIIGGPYMGGNIWANPKGTGFSQTCKDVNGDGICDKSYILGAKNIDYLPISMNFTKDKIPPKSVRVNISGFDFQPQIVKVVKGTKIIWTNKDAANHTVTSDTGLFDSGIIRSGKTYSRIFNVTGNYGYHCKIHASMTGSVIVL